ncbi:hypothetical protein AAER32_12865 [Pseudomonas aeruginosa]|nr:hypothetical protein [Pseudomonas aeruginosa]MDP5565895.1 hypothetical protein [Pseudomonas aeruginosa]MDP5746564.1 hypothetical protein [Pseudomonas aeruginosa]MDP5778002.1 hypothetical protein [Pseudomonas aeruginosa]
MSEVKRFDHVNLAHVDDCEHIATPEGAWVKASDYDALVAKLAMAEDAAAKGDAARQQCGGMEMEIQELRAELAALRARVVVVPERELFTQYLPGAIPRNADEVSAWKEGWNACLDELARINGLTVSEGLLRRIVTPALTSSDAQDRIGALEELRALLSEQEGGNDVSNHQ